MVAVSVCAMAGAAIAADAPADRSPVESMQHTVVEWAKVRSETVRLEENWRQEQELMHSTLVALQEQVAKLETEKKTLDASTAEERKGLADLATQNAATEAALTGAGTSLQRMAGELVALRPWLPPRLSSALDLPYRSLADPQLSAPERMQFVATILNRCGQFGRVITADEEVLTPEGETEGRMYEVIYWGMGAGYALDRTAGKAYWGHPGPRGWTWQYQAGLAPVVTQLLSVRRDQTEPKTLEVPVQIGAALPPLTDAR